MLYKLINLGAHAGAAEETLYDEPVLADPEPDGDRGLKANAGEYLVVDGSAA